jgi:hypothetical protein
VVRADHVHGEAPAEFFEVKTPGQRPGQLAGVEIHKGSDGFIHETDVTSRAHALHSRCRARDHRSLHNAPICSIGRSRLDITRSSPRSASCFCKDALPSTGARTNIRHSFAMGNREGIDRCAKKTRPRGAQIALM